MGIKKCSGYIQSWYQKELSTPVFDKKLWLGWQNHSI